MIGYSLRTIFSPNFGLEGFERTVAHAANMRLNEMAGAVVKRTVCFYQNLCLVDSEVPRNPLLRQAPNRYRAF